MIILLFSYSLLDDQAQYYCKIKNIFINSRPNDTDAAVWVNFIIMTFEISATAWSSSHGGISSPKEIVAAAAVPVCVYYFQLCCAFSIYFLKDNAARFFFLLLTLYSLLTTFRPLFIACFAAKFQSYTIVYHKQDLRSKLKWFYGRRCSFCWFHTNLDCCCLEFLMCRNVTLALVI